MPKTYIDEMGIVRLIPKKPKPKPEGVLDLFGHPLDNPPVDPPIEIQRKANEWLNKRISGTNPPLAHRNDPPAAKEGARHITESGKSAAHKRLILAKIKAHPGITVKEIAARIPTLSFDQVQKRHSDLFREGVIPKDG